ncbi:hypothetical protein HB837_15370 [Listeria innocua]|uniref:hypothetical protein n=1 Tax=Listeria innocua TaxID=1642 RepID=UPI00162797D8|nr:hypothetical protein [Listeria innocua]MBC1353790.1 hypothetical protein [Listeria innocua]
MNYKEKMELSRCCREKLIKIISAIQADEEKLRKENELLELKKLILDSLKKV